MGILSSLGKLAGGAIGFVAGGPAGAAAGWAVGGELGNVGDDVVGTVSDVFGGGKGKKGSGGQAQAAPAKPDISALLEDSPDLAAILGGQGATQTASVYEGMRDSNDPKMRSWAPTFEWYEDLGGDPSKTRPEVLSL